MTKTVKILPISAFALGLVLVGITSGFKTVNSAKQATHTFEYAPLATDPNPAYSKASVEDVANWAPTDETCPNGSAMACTIEASQVNSSATELLPAENIVATEVSGVAHVTSTFDSGNPANINNRD